LPQTDPSDFTVAATARLLGISRQAVERKIGTTFHVVAGFHTVRLDGAEVLAAHRRSYHDLQAKVLALTNAGVELGVQSSAQPVATTAGALTVEEPEPSSDLGNLLRGTLERLSEAEERIGVERAGRAVAEARIDELTRDLKRANAAIDRLQDVVSALKADTDVDLDAAPS